MVGGIVVEVCETPNKPDRLYIDCADHTYKRVERCAIYVERNEISEKIEIGDSLWWQGNYAMWTPKKNRESKEKNRGGIDYDIKIPRIGFSGVNHPLTKKDNDE